MDCFQWFFSNPYGVMLLRWLAVAALPVTMFLLRLEMLLPFRKFQT